MPPSIENLYNDFNIYEINLKLKKHDELKLIYPKENLILENVKFKYPKNDQYILKNINIKIDANTITGFVGFTGSGKTTLIDILLGLLNTDRGNLKIDGSLSNKIIIIGRNL